VGNKAKDLTQSLVPPRQKKPQKNGKMVSKQMGQWQTSLLNTVGSGVSAAQDTLQSGIDYTQAVFTKKPKQARKRWKKAQKKLKKAQSTLQQSMGTGLASTQKAWQQGTKQAQQSMGVGLASTQKAWQQGTKQAQQAASSAREMRDDWQRRRMRARRRVVRSRRFFRLGVAVGIVLALLYAPIAGSEVRRRIVERFQQTRAVLGF
jgi:gas vesicle protein